MAQKAIVGEKVGMTQVWDENNNIVPVTVVRVTPCRVVQVKTAASDGYSAIQVTVGAKEARKLSKPEAGHFAVSPPGTVELDVEGHSSFTPGPGRHRHLDVERMTPEGAEAAVVRMVELVTGSG